jgi:phospholipid/cholesterol/gamma-HCH transport system substrate-binding protein
MKLAIKRHAGDFVAIVAMGILAIVVTGYILAKQGVRFPFVESSPYTINAEFSTAQAVTPGQGQSVNVSGVKVGDISGVELKNGYAVVKRSIDPQYQHLVHSDATALLRPKTGLQDMFVELNPGSKQAPLVKPGFTIPLKNTDPEINLDEVLSSLDADTRQYLDLLVNGAGQGLNHNSSELAQVLERFEPTHRDLARLNGALAQRGRDLQQLVNSLQRLNTSLASKKTQIVELIDSSSRVFAALASEEGNISRAVRDLPPTLQQTSITLAKVQRFAQLLGPTATKLLPAASALPAANHALAALAKPAAPIVQHEIRPFVIAAQPVVRELESPAIKLAKAAPNLDKTFVVVNHLLNLVGYNPTNEATNTHGYLWWLSWLGHVGRTVFGVQDGNGDYRQAFLQLSCDTIAQILNSLNPQLISLINSLGLLSLLGKTGTCPSQATALNSAFAKYKTTGVNPSFSNSKKAGNLNLSTLANATSALSVLMQGSGKDLSALGLQHLDLKHLFLPVLPTH